MTFGGRLYLEYYLKEVITSHCDSNKWKMFGLEWGRVMKWPLKGSHAMRTGTMPTAFWLAIDVVLGHGPLNTKTFEFMFLTLVNIKLVLFKAGSSLSISPDDRSGVVVNPSVVTHEAEGAWSWVQGQHWLHNKTLSQKKRKEKMVRRKWWIVSLSTRSGHVWITTQWKNGNCDTVPWEIAEDLSTESNAVSAFHNH